MRLASRTRRKSLHGNRLPMTTVLSYCQSYRPQGGGFDLVCLTPMAVSGPSVRTMGTHNGLRSHDRRGGYPARAYERGYRRISCTQGVDTPCTRFCRNVEWTDRRIWGICGQSRVLPFGEVVETIGAEWTGIPISQWFTFRGEEYASCSVSAS